jgi:hypothetical protein
MSTDGFRDADGVWRSHGATGPPQPPSDAEQQTQIEALRADIAALQAFTDTTRAAQQAELDALRADVSELQTFVMVLRNAATVYEARENKNMQALTTTRDYMLACAQPILAAPAADGYVRVSVNGQGVELGDGTRDADCYFSGESDGATPRPISEIQAGDSLWWVGTIAGFELAAATDVISFDYERE